MILCTKNDLPDAVNVREIMKILEYDKLKQNPYLYVEMKSVNGLSGLNTDEALSFFNFYIKSKWLVQFRTDSITFFILCERYTILEGFRWVRVMRPDFWI